MTDATQHKERLLEYFDGLGFERWSAIYGDGAVSRIRHTIREGHARMLALAEAWLCERLRVDDRPLTADDGVQSPGGGPPLVLDAGCGTGLMTIALARRGMRVTAVDIAPQMAAATVEAARAAGVAERVAARAGDLEEIDGRYDAVVCLDVLIHYPAEGFVPMVRRLTSVTDGPLILTYAPHEPLLAAMHWLGGRFPRAHRRTEIQMIRDGVVRRALAETGRTVRRSARVSRGFYHVTLVEAGRISREGHEEEKHTKKER